MGRGVGGGGVVDTGGEEVAAFAGGEGGGGGAEEERGEEEEEEREGVGEGGHGSGGDVPMGYRGRLVGWVEDGVVC